MSRWPLYPVTVVGSWPRPSWLLEAMKKKRADLRALQDEATLLAIKYQEDAGVDIISDGEQRRDNFYSFICDRLDGIRLMSMAELLALAAAGADVVQFDEPVLTELVFAGKSATRTFMCAALAAGASPEKELDLAVDLIHRGVEGLAGPILA